MRQRKLNVIQGTDLVAIAVKGLEAGEKGLEPGVEEASPPLTTLTTLTESGPSSPFPLTVRRKKDGPSAEEVVGGRVALRLTDDVLRLGGAGEDEDFEKTTRRVGDESWMGLNFLGGGFDFGRVARPWLTGLEGEGRVVRSRQAEERRRREPLGERAIFDRPMAEESLEQEKGSSQGLNPKRT